MNRLVTVQVMITDNEQIHSPAFFVGMQHTYRRPSFIRTSVIRNAFLTAIMTKKWLQLFSYLGSELVWYIKSRSLWKGTKCAIYGAICKAPSSFFQVNE